MNYSNIDLLYSYILGMFLQYEVFYNTNNFVTEFAKIEITDIVFCSFA